MRQEIKPIESTNMSSYRETGVIGSYAPRSLDEWMKISTMIANSNLCPNDFRGKPESVFIACQMGADVGLKPMQAIQNIAVINGRPCLWGDAALAVVKSHHDFIDIEEIISGDKATCIIKRKGSKDVVREFTQADAQTAGLWGKAGPWKQYPSRMLQMRARGFALRDAFPDALRGINIAEEVRDYPVEEKDVTPVSVHDEIYTELLNQILACGTIDELERLKKEKLKNYKANQQNIEKLRSAYKNKMQFLSSQNEDDLTQAMEAHHVDESVPAE